MYECQQNFSYMYNMHVFILGEQRWLPLLKYWEYNAFFQKRKEKKKNNNNSKKKKETHSPTERNDNNVNKTTRDAWVAEAWR